MNDEQEKQKIRDVIDTWIKASAAADFNRVLPLTAKDVVFLRPGHPDMKGKIHFEGRSDIREIQITGNYAFVWNYMSASVTPLPDGSPKRLGGNILSVFRKEPDGRWVLFRDANMLTPI